MSLNSPTAVNLFASVRGPEDTSELDISLVESLPGMGARDEFERIESAVSVVHTSSAPRAAPLAPSPAKIAATAAAELPALDTASMTPAERALAAVVVAKVAALSDALARSEAHAAALAEERAKVRQRGAAADDAARAAATEKSEFIRWRDAEVAALEARKADEAARTERERRVAIRQARATVAAEKGGPERAERAEIETLKASERALRADLGAAEVRARAAAERHRAIVSKLEERVAELEASVRGYEAERIAAVFGPTVGASSAASIGGGVGGAVAVGGAKGAVKGTVTAAPAGAAPARRVAPPPLAPTAVSAAPPSTQQPPSYAAAHASKTTALVGAASVGGSVARPRGGAPPLTAHRQRASEASTAVKVVAVTSSHSPPVTAAVPGRAGDAYNGGGQTSTASQSMALWEGMDYDGADDNAAFSASADASDSSFIAFEAAAAATEDFGEVVVPTGSTASTAVVTSSSRGVHAPSAPTRLHATRPADIDTATHMLASASAGAGVQRGVVRPDHISTASPNAQPPIRSGGSGGEPSAAVPPARAGGGGGGAATGVSLNAGTGGGGGVHAGWAIPRSLGAPHALNAPLPPAPQTHTSELPLPPTSPPFDASAYSGSLSRQLRAHFARGVSSASLKTSVTNVFPPVTVVSQTALDGGKVETRFADGTRLVRFKNGTEREIACGDDAATTVRFANGDVKRTEVSGVECYWYAEAGTLQTSYPETPHDDAFDIFDFELTGQVERHVGGVTVEVAFRRL